MTADSMHVIDGADQVKETDLIKLNGKTVKRTGYRVIAIE